MATVPLNVDAQGLLDEIVELLVEVPELLAKFVKFAEEFYKLQGKPTAPAGGPADNKGPPKVNIGSAPPEIKTAGITAEELDLLAQDAAEAAVKARAVAFVKGFFATAVLLA